MDSLIELLKGPIFLFTFSFMLLGLLREILLTSWSSFGVFRRAGDRRIGTRTLLRRTVAWFLPIGTLKTHPVFLLNSVLFHLSVVVVPLFLLGHIALWKEGLGIAWVGLPNPVATVLTITAILTTANFMVYRLSTEPAIQNTRFSDLCILLAVSLPFSTGLLLMHPSASPLSYQWNLLLHLIASELLFVLIPTTKLRHLILFPILQLVSELGWHWPQSAATEVGLAIGKRGAQP